MTHEPPFMSTDSQVRKNMPVASGVLAYFPDALLCVAWISRVGNDKHNPGEPLHWAKDKSSDEPDAEVRHLLDHVRGLPPDPGLEGLGRLGHLASKAWRALAHLQRECDRERAAVAELDAAAAKIVPLWDYSKTFDENINAGCTWDPDVEPPRFTLPAVPDLDELDPFPCCGAV